MAQPPVLFCCSGGAKGPGMGSAFSHTEGGGAPEQPQVPPRPLAPLKRGGNRSCCLPGQGQFHSLHISPAEAKGTPAQSFMGTQVRNENCPPALRPERHIPSMSKGPWGKPNTPRAVMDQDGWEWGVLSFAGHEFSSLSQNPFHQHLLLRCAAPGHGTDGFGHNRAMMGQWEGAVRDR